MMLNENSRDNIDRFSEMMNTVPYKNHFRIHHVHNVELRESWSLPSRTIDDYILAFIRSGTGHYEIEGKQFPIEKGNIFIISPGVNFSTMQYDQVPSLLSVRFGIYDNATGAEKKDVSNPFYLCFTPEDIEHYRMKFYEVYSQFLSGEYPVKENALLSLILGDIVTDITNRISKPGFDMRLESARVYIEKNIRSETDINKLSEIAGLSAAYFSKKFKHQYGLTPKAYIHQSRMTYAKLLLTEYRYNVKEVSVILRYSDPYIFSNQFKAYWGYAPSKAKMI